MITGKISRKLEGSYQQLMVVLSRLQREEDLGETICTRRRTRRFRYCDLHQEDTAQRMTQVTRGDPRLLHPLGNMNRLVNR